MSIKAHKTPFDECVFFRYESLISDDIMTN